jgi:hypothetical protein
MQLSNPNKILLLFVISSLLLTACGGAKTGDISAVPGPDAPRTEPPFQNKEPDAYQAEIWRITGSTTEKFRISRKGDKWRVDSAYGDADQVTSMKTDQNYILSFAAKSFAEYPSTHGYDDRAGMVEEMTGGMLNRRDVAVYEKTGSQGGMTTYRVNGEPGKPVESIVTVDDKIGLPVSKEIYKLEGGRTLDVTIKLSGFRTEVDDSIFAIPADFKKVPLTDMKGVLTAPK